MRDLRIPVQNTETEETGVRPDIITGKANIKENPEELPEGNDQNQGKKPVHPQTKVRLVADKAFFGPGTQQLMELIEQTGSLQEACLSMKLSYSKGSRMIKDAERQLGFPISQRWAGGTGGGGSSLTDEGKQFLKNYRNMALEVQEYAEQVYIKYFLNKEHPL